MRVALCLIVRNEVHDLLEWIVHHLELGFSAIFVYDNESDDGTSELLDVLSAVLPVIRISWPSAGHDNAQIDSYAHCLGATRGQFDWLAAIDADEFFVSLFDEKIADLLMRLHSHVHIGINWLMFGSSSLSETNGRLVLEAFTYRAPLEFGPNAHIKSIVRPDRMIGCINAHTFHSEHPVVNVFGQTIDQWDNFGLVKHARIVQGPWRIHHYFTRSKAHWQRRRLRMRNANFDLHRSDTDFELYDRNEIIDESAVRYAASVRDAMRKLTEALPAVDRRV